MKDLENATAQFRTWANQYDFEYAAWILVPEFATDVQFDVGWLGAWPNGESFGLSMEKWKSPDHTLVSVFSEVIDCGTHELSMSLPVNAPESTPEDGILMFYSCSLHEGKSFNDAYAGHLEWGEVMKGMGSLAISWVFQPAIGAGSDAPDYYHAVGFYRYSDLGAAMDLYANRGGLEARDRILGGVSHCETPPVFDAHSVRARDER